MIQPKRAPVRPRIICPASGEALPLEDEIRRLLDGGVRGIVAILGEAGAGKTTALEHLAAVLPPEAGVSLLDEDEWAKMVSAPAGTLAIYAAQHVNSKAPHAKYWLAPWVNDDLIEYLLARHKDHCSSVMARLKPTDHALCGGRPELLHAVLEALVDDNSLLEARSALRRAATRSLGDAELLHQMRLHCLGEIGISQREKQAAPKRVFPDRAMRLMRHRPVRLLLAADLIADDLRGDGNACYLLHRLPRDLVAAVATAIAGESPCHERLLHLLAGPSRNHAMAASILWALGNPWMPQPGSAMDLRDAYLDRVTWPGVVLAHGKLDHADFTGADLSDADLRSASAYKVAMGNALLNRAVLERIDARRASFAGADLSEARACNACFDKASFRGANLTDAVLNRASFIGADLTGAMFRGAELEEANLLGTIEGADFTGAFLEGARLSGLRLRDAIWTNAAFGAAQMAGCDLEGLELPHACFEDANLEGALLTGCVMPGANFDNACLKSAGLGDVNWEGASLREADLRGATFHMGSSRSGLVGSPIASEGSRTGFYTDDYEEQYYKAPEEIRKANLCRADLRGALVDDVDFYLVDLRGAQYDAEHEDHFRRCGAILKARVED